MRTSSLRAPLIALLVLFAFGCDSTSEFRGGATAVLVANQGNFNDGNGSVVAYDPATQTVNPALVTNIGSIIQSLYLDASGQVLFVAANTGNRIDIYDLNTAARVAQVTGLVSPRYMTQAGTKLYVTNLYGAADSFTGGKVSVIDLLTFTKVKDITVGNNPEGIVAAGNRLYVANHGFGAGRTVSVIDRTTDEVTQTLNVDCDGPRFLAADAEQEVWVFCTGQTIFDANYNVVGGTNGAVRVIDGRTGEIQQRIAIEGRIGAEGPGQDAFHHPRGREIFVVKDLRTVLRFRTDTNALAESFTVTGDPIGAVGFDTINEQLYLGRVSGFTTSGTVSIHSRAGIETGRFNAGVAPTYISFIHLVAN